MEKEWIKISSVPPEPKTTHIVKCNRIGCKKTCSADFDGYWETACQNKPSHYQVIKGRQI